MKAENVFISASVTEGHPDKLCDQISDAIVDHYLQLDTAARLAVECAVSSGVVFIASRIASEINIDLAEIARSVIAEVGYLQGDFNSRDCSVMLSQASTPQEMAPHPDLSTLNRKAAGSFVATHQATLFGYACRQTEELMPLPIVLANQLAKRLAEMRHQEQMPYLAPDGQVQVAIGYRDNRPVGVEAVSLLTAQTDKGAASPERLRDDVIQMVIEPVLSKFDLGINSKTRININPDGAIIGGGPVMHSGMTGRKTGMDTYGDYSRQSGAALSGKDPLRIDRIGAYAARYAAKHVVAAGLADECELQLSYTVGEARPVSLRVHTYGTSAMEEAKIAGLLKEVFDFRPGIIAKDLALQQLPAERSRFYQNLAVHGHMGREDLDAPWERLDRLDAMKAG